VGQAHGSGTADVVALGDAADLDGVCARGQRRFRYRTHLGSPISLGVVNTGKMRDGGASSIPLL
jgi:hypothetical protein